MSLHLFDQGILGQLGFLCRLHWDEGVGQRFVVVAVEALTAHLMHWHDERPLVEGRYYYTVVDKRGLVLVQRLSVSAWYRLLGLWRAHLQPQVLLLVHLRIVLDLLLGRRRVVLDDHRGDLHEAR